MKKLKDNHMKYFNHRRASPTSSGWIGDCSYCPNTAVYGQQSNRYVSYCRTHALNCLYRLYRASPRSLNEFEENALLKLNDGRLSDEECQDLAIGRIQDLIDIANWLHA